jgi:phage baseplate assembly protein V
VREIPALSLEAGGAPLDPAELRALVAVRVQQRLSLPAQCELTFADPPGPLATAGRLLPGLALRIAVRGQRDPLFDGEITAVEQVYGPAREREIRVRGYDLLHRLRKRQSPRAHVQVTPADLARELAADLGVTVETADSGPLWPHLIQHQQSDLELLVQLAERCGLYLTLQAGTLHLITLEGHGEALPLELGRTLLEARVELNGDPAVREVAATGWDSARVEVHTGRSTSARLGREVSAEVLPQDVGGDGSRSLLNERTPDDRHAEALAQAELDRRLAREVTLWGVAEGDTRLRPGAPLTVTGLADTLTGRYVITTATHTLDERMGYVVEFNTAPPQPAARALSAVVAPAVVSSVDDPDGLGRVRVTLPTYGDVESDWLCVLVPGAGSGKGLMALPDAGDQVLVLLTHDDPGEGVVLGGLYGAGGWPDTGIEGGAVRRYTLLTPGGQRIRLDDAGQAIRVENELGSFVELAPDKVRLHAATDLELEAPGRKVVIRGQTIDFERG